MTHTVSGGVFRLVMTCIPETSHGPRWVSAVVEETTGPVSYTVQTGDGRVMRRHVDQIRKRHTTVSTEAPIPEVTVEPTGLQVPDPVLEALPADCAITTSVREKMAAPDTAQAHPSAVEKPDAGVVPLPVLRCSERKSLLLT